MKKLLFTLLLLLPQLAICQAGAPVFSIINGEIKTNESLITPPDKMVVDLKFTLKTSFDVNVGGTVYTMQTGRYVGWENEPGDFDVVRFSRNGREELLYRSYDGIVRMDDEKNLYSRQFERYSREGHFMEVELTPNTKALIFLGQHYGTDVARFIVFVLTESDVKVVCNMYGEIKGIVKSDEQFSVQLQSNIVESGTATQADIHDLWLRDGVLYYGKR